MMHPKNHMANTLVVAILVSLVLPLIALADMDFDANEVDSIHHFRAFAPQLQSKQSFAYTAQTKLDKYGYLWLTGGAAVQRYNGYEIESFTYLQLRENGDYGAPFLFLDDEKNLWVADQGIHLFDYKTEALETFDPLNRQFTRAMQDDGEGNLWLAGRQTGFKLLNKKTKKIIPEFDSMNFSDKFRDIYSIAYNQENKNLWISSSDGIYLFNKETKQVRKIVTPVDEYFSHFTLRDISLDTQQKALWIATSKGAIRVDTDDYSARLFEYATSSERQDTLPLDATTTFLDSSGNLWLGLEKLGLCVYRNKLEDFICVESSIGDPEKLPVATVEDISEDQGGSLWIAVNHYGVSRITPSLERITELNEAAKEPLPDYFSHTHDGVVRENGDIWFATDGGGINIFNYKTREIRNIQHDRNNENSLPGNSLIDMTLDENGYIWASFWGAGVTKIDPETMTFTNFTAPTILSNSESSAPKYTEQLMGNNSFVVESDQNGGIWIGIWNIGLQYFNQNTKEFTNYDFRDQSKEGNIFNSEVVQIAFHSDKVWIVGAGGLEIFDPKTNRFTMLWENEDDATAVEINDLENVYVGTRRGLLKLNVLTGESKRYTTKDGLTDDDIFYLKTDSFGKLWIATNNGVSIFDKEKETFEKLFKKDGLVGDKLSASGAFLEIDQKLYIPGKLGVNIVDITNVPHYTYAPKTVLSAVSYINQNEESGEDNKFKLKFLSNPRIGFHQNSLKFSMAALSFVFPERNRFRYRLAGWQKEFVEVGASERTVRFTNLPAGKYTFEAFASNGVGTWDKEGVRYPFTILPPWYVTWWALLLYVLASALLVYSFMRFRLAANIKRERDLSLKVKEKTKQLEKSAQELKVSGDSLFKLNAELEQRVEARTAELRVEVNERKVAESKLFHMAFHDALTGLPNRQWLIEKLKKAIERCYQDKSHRYGLMFLDGDRFKQVNDTHGHSVGDQLLISAGERLSSLMQKNQYTARLGGDEFTVYIEQVDDPQNVEILAEQIVEAFKKPFLIEKHTIVFHMSIGLVVCDSHYKVVSGILRDADIAMYGAKEAGKANFKVFDAEMRTRAIDLTKLEEDLYRAVEHNEFFLVYQPILDLERDMVTGFEALIRWQHPTKGLIPPFNFISIAEENGLIWEIGKWVLEESCRQMNEWHSLGLTNKPMVSVNLSTCQLRNTDFINVVDQTIEESRIDTKYLKLELTETMLIENNETINTLIEQLKSRGIDLAIDDFGTGYSSLAYLNEIPVQYIKIDKKFIDAIDATANGDVNDDALKIVKATISLGQSLRKKVIAEGIESKQQLDALREFNCDFAQGYYIDKPLSIEDATKLLTKDKKAIIDIVTRSKTQKTQLSRYKDKLNERTPRLRDRH